MKKNFTLRTLIFLFVSAISIVLFSCAPNVPHEVASKKDETCRGCHQDKESGAPLVDHVKRNDCLHCHEIDPQLVAGK